MAIEIKTEQYEFSHGKKPRGEGCWAFTREASHGKPARTFFIPHTTFREACTMARKQVRNEGFQDAIVQVAP